MYPQKCNLVVRNMLTQVMPEALLGEAVGGLCTGLGRVRLQLCTDPGALIAWFPGRRLFFQLREGKSQGLVSEVV